MAALWNGLQALRDNWEEEDYPKAEDFKYMLVFALFFVTLRYILDQFVFEVIGRRLLFPKSTSPQAGSKSLKESLIQIDKDALEKTLIKFKESCWKASYFLSAEIFALTVSIGEPHFQDTKYIWIGPGDRRWPDQTMKVKLRTLYAFVGGFYTYSIFALVFWETRRRDFVVSMTHHVSSVTLVCVSYIFRFGRLCSTIVALHDASDVFLEVAKICRYLGFELIATISFAIFALSWAWLRLWFFPTHVIYSSSVQVVKLLPEQAFSPTGPPLYYLFNFILILLLVLHVYWWILIAKVIYRQIAGSGLDDVRSDEDDD